MGEVRDPRLEGERIAFAEELGQWFEDRGLPRMEGRVAAWLVVCDPPEQSAEDLAEVLGASRGAISMATRLLQRAGAVEKVNQPGSRKFYYRLRPAMWRQDIDKRLEEAVQVREMAAKGLERLGEAPGGQLDRLRDMYQMYDFLVEEYTHTRDRWHRQEEGKGER